LPLEKRFEPSLLYLPSFVADGPGDFLGLVEVFGPSADRRLRRQRGLPRFSLRHRLPVHKHIPQIVRPGGVQRRLHQ